MSELFFADLVQETSQSMGMENMRLDGPTAGHRSFESSVPEGRTFYYAIVHRDEPNQWEVGIGHLDAQSELVRSPIISSQNAAATDFSAGRKNINLTISADWYNQQNSQVLEHSHDAANIEGLEQALAAKQNTGDYADADHSHDAASIEGLEQALAAKQNTGDYADADHGHVFSDLGINELTPQNFLRTNDRIAVTSGSSGQNFVTIAGDMFPARRAAGGNIISPASIEIPSGRVQLSYAASNPIAGPALRWGSSYTRMLGFYINAGLNYQGDQFNGAFNIRTQTDNGALGGITVSLHPQEASKFRYGIAPMLDNRCDIGAANKRFSNIYLANNPIVTSDERHKENIAPITDQMLNWYGAIIQWKNFTMKGEGGKDGDGKIQIGVLAQDIERGAKAVGMDDSQIATMGLLNYHAWEAEYEENPKLDDDGHIMLNDDGAPLLERVLIQDAGDSYGVKYDQLFALASAWSLRETKRQQTEINALKAQVAALSEAS